MPTPLLLIATATASLQAGTVAVQEFRVDDALAHLERAKSEGPYRHADHVRLYEQLGIAHAYAGHEASAIEAFDRMLALDPAHGLAYTLSPKATLVFEKARTSAGRRPTPALALGLPHDPEVGEPLPIDLDVIADPFRSFFVAEIRHRASGKAWQTTKVELTDPSGRHRAVLPGAGGEESTTMIIEVSVLDRAGNEVHVLPERTIPIRWIQPQPWYEKWWVWTLAGAVVVAGTTTAVVMATRDPDPLIDVNVRRE